MTEPSAAPTPDPEYQNIVHRFVAFMVVVLIFAPALATLITVLFFGMRILIHGSQTCQVLFQQSAWDLILYTSCGCALVEIMVSLISIVALRFTTPRLIKHFQYIWKQRKIGS